MTSKWIIIGLLALMACNRPEKMEKGFSVSDVSESTEEETENFDGISKENAFKTRPTTVLLIGNAKHRLTTIFKLNYNKDSTRIFTGSTNFHNTYVERYSEGNQWNYSYMPGINAVYGYNMVNVSHFNLETKKRKEFFNKPVLIKTLYFPSFSKDTLNFEPVLRDFYMVSVYNEDTNKDGFINLKDLRRLYYFDVNVENQQALIPENYSVLRSEYDSANDYMYVFAQLDENKDGSKSEEEPIHIFEIDLKNPTNRGRHY